MTRLIPPALGLICALGLLPVSAAEPPASGEAAEAAVDEVAASAEPAAGRLPRHCLGHTGTRIPRAQARCSVGGRVYTREDLERSGGMDIGDSLRRVDPRIGSGWR